MKRARVKKMIAIQITRKLLPSDEEGVQLQTREMSKARVLPRGQRSSAASEVWLYDAKQDWRTNCGKA